MRKNYRASAGKQTLVTKPNSVILATQGRIKGKITDKSGANPEWFPLVHTNLLMLQPTKNCVSLETLD